MRRLLTISASLTALALSACGESERPVLLSGALYHGFTRVDPDTPTALVPNAWVVLADGRLSNRVRGRRRPAISSPRSTCPAPES
jgi:hypothetical protein